MQLDRRVQTSLANTLQSDDGPFGHDQTANIVAQAAWTGLLPPGSNSQTVDAACLQVHARRLGVKIDTAQAALLLDLRAGRAEEQLIAAHGEDFPALGGKLWKALDVSGHWIGAHQAGALVEQATMRGLFNRIATPPPVDPPAIRLVMPEVTSLASAAAPVFNGYPLAPEVIAAAPSLDVDKVATFKEWQIERNSVPAGQAYMQVFRNRKALEKQLGMPDAQTILAIAAKATNEGKLSPAELFEVQRNIAAKLLTLNKGHLDVLEPLAAGCTVGASRYMAWDQPLQEQHQSSEQNTWRRRLSQRSHGPATNTECRVCGWPAPGTGHPC